MSKQLFHDGSDSDVGIEFKTNEVYANSYNKFRSKELLKKLKDKNPNPSESNSSSESDSSDDDGTINPKFDEAFYKTLASLKQKHPAIYNKNVTFFKDFDTVKIGNSKISKSLTVKDYERNILLKKGGKYEDEENLQETASPSYNEEQNIIKNEFKKVIVQDDSDDENEWGGIFRKREKTKDEEEKEEANYSKWLAGENSNIDENQVMLKPLKDYWSNSKLAKGEAFLRDYVLSNGYSNTNHDQIPTYDDIVGISEDEAELEKQADFEHKYNFRFEEPDAGFIQRYPRTIEHSVRKTDDRRKEKRIEVKERKTKEKEQKLRDLEILSALRKKEIEDKINKLKQIIGNEDLPFDNDDLDGDFDPDEYDKKMQAVFNNEYYQIDEGDTKPECPDIEELIVEDWDNYDPRKDDIENELHCEDDEFNMNCEYDAEQKKKSLQDQLIENTRDRRKRRKRKSKFVEMLKKEKPVFDPNDLKTYDEYIDEYYKLDYEDIIGDIPCRFKYVETVPNDFGLTVDEILLAKNKELNQWASLKKATQIRPEHVEKNEVKMFKNKSKNKALKRKILISLYDDSSAEEDSGEEPVKKKVANKSHDVKIVKTKKDKTDEKDHTPKLLEAVTKSKVKFPISEEGEIIKKTKSNGTKNCINTASDDCLTQTKQKDNNANKQKNPFIVKKLKILSQEKKHKITPQNTQENLKIEKKHLKIKKLNNKPAKQESSSISEERLRAFGINPKKYFKKLKYSNRQNDSVVKPIPNKAKEKNIKNKNKFKKINSSMKEQQ